MDVSDPRAIRIDVVGAEVAEGVLFKGMLPYGPPEDLTVTIVTSADVPEFTDACVWATEPVTDPADGVVMCADSYDLRSSDPCVDGASLL